MQVTTKTLIAMHADGLSDQAIADRTGVELATVERVITTHQNNLAAGRATAAATPAPAGTAVPDAADLLPWAEAHVEASIRQAGARARAALELLQTRRRTDAELQGIKRTEQELEARLAKLRARAAELKGGRGKQVKPRDYVPAEVRAWAREEGIPCPPAGVVPASVVDAWRTAHATA
ncbi:MULTISPECIES: Lsr2 family protein [Streptomyces]|uniref:Lsr2 family DNA-binding protein n=1 Tax=Streptomyces TaxID=1883 RepID=UPI0004BDE322|nr:MULTISPECIES: Lsr2 family protein [Streptomyces]